MSGQATFYMRREVRAVVEAKLNRPEGNNND